MTVTPPAARSSEAIREHRCRRRRGHGTRRGSAGASRFGFDREDLDLLFLAVLEDAEVRGRQVLRTGSPGLVVHDDVDVDEADARAKGRPVLSETCDAARAAVEDCC